MYMWASELLATLQVGSIFEYANRNPLFGAVKPDNFLWAPILLFFAITGFPSAGNCSTLPYGCVLMLAELLVQYNVHPHALITAVALKCTKTPMSAHGAAGFLFIKAINAANKDAERQDKIDGY